MKRSLNFLQKIGLKNSKHTFTKLIIVVIVFGVATSCNKDELGLIKNNNDVETKFLTPRTLDACSVFGMGLISNHLKYYGDADPALYFPGDDYSDILAEFEDEMTVMKGMGLYDYVDDLEENQLVSNDLRDLITHIYSSVDVVESVDVNNLKEELEEYYDPEVVDNYEEYYCLIYNIAIQIYEEFYSGNPITPRGDCKFKDFIAHVIESATVGIAIGAAVGQILLSNSGGNLVITLAGITITVTGGVIGGFFGALIGIFTFDNDSCDDCSSVDAISIERDNNCDLTGVYLAIGAGSDALAFTWNVSQGQNSVQLTTSVPRLTITQATNNVPIHVDVASWCDNEGTPEQTEPTPTVELDLSTDSSSPLGQPGTTEILAINGGFGSGTSGGYVTSSVNQFTTFVWSNTNEGSGHIQFTPSVQPGSLGVIVQVINDHSVKVRWSLAGSGVFRVVAINTCSGLTSTTNLPVVISN